ncbi:hypothetical protein [Rhizobium sp. SSA_523]|uniref:hypothetical protein n=1 Tax=Rhizobium sp. SSA_523 TaxID=2952477 RepID=UPI002091AD36|nr:hypothetical protein [Rhizobium sp. SSA_523]MCO5732850.1 hypothetical protein [Rhizobium sp. SSA_523]WKC23533.1 hypothetical protein QTJ18_22500 [Rhizobium sp. SSA_523]
MTEQTIKDADKTMIKNEGPRRFNESLDMSKTPEQEVKEGEKHRAIRPKSSYGTTK